MDAGWFMQEVHARTQYCDFPPLVTTGSDGDNGGWFRNVSEKGNFWGVFYRPLLDLVRRGQTEVVPGFIEDYLQQHGVWGEVHVRSGAWKHRLARRRGLYAVDRLPSATGCPPAPSPKQPGLPWGQPASRSEGSGSIRI